VEQLMSFAFDLGVIPPEQRLEAWRQAASRLIHPMVVRADQAPVKGTVIKRDDSGMRSIRVAGVRSSVERPSGLIGVDDPAFLQLTLVHQGRLQIEQEDAAGELRAGDLVWYSSARAYRLAALEEFDLTHFLIPGSCTPLLREFLAPEPATPLGRDSASFQVLGAFLGGVATWQARGEGSGAGGALESALLHLIGSLPGPERAPAASQPDTFARARGHIDEHLAEPGLSPTRIAEALHVSVRHLHACFSRQGVSVGAHIRNARLDRAARDLADPAHAGAAVGEIAHRWGFSSAAHFTRVFVARFGHPPGRRRPVI
jgi:AraC-like DNA-binding protein